MVLIKPANIPHCVKNSQKCVGNSDVSSSVQDFHRLHFEIVTYAAASTPKEVRAYPQRGSGPVSQAHLERGLRLDLVNANWSYSPERHDSGKTRWFFYPCDFEILQMTLKNNMAPLLCYFKLCASFQSHWWSQTWVTVRKRSIRVKICIFCSAWPWNFMDDLEKQ